MDLADRRQPSARSAPTAGVSWPCNVCSAYLRGDVLRDRRSARPRSSRPSGCPTLGCVTHHLTSPRSPWPQLLEPARSSRCQRSSSRHASAPTSARSAQGRNTSGAHPRTRDTADHGRPRHFDCDRSHRHPRLLLPQLLPVLLRRCHDSHPPGLRASTEPDRFHRAWARS